MRDDELDRILSNETEIAPSSGFTGSVMDAIRHGISEPPPIPFPWKRALPGLAVCAAGLSWLVVEGIRLPTQEQAAGTSFMHDLPMLAGSWLRTLDAFGGLWILLAVLTTLATVKLSMRLAGGR